MSPEHGPEQVQRAVRAVGVIFLACGLNLSSWLARIPQVRDALHLSPKSLGVVILCVAIGSLIALPTAGWIVHHLKPRRTIVLMASLCVAGVALAAIGIHVGRPMVMAALVLAGFGTGAWDVAMNVDAAAVEQLAGRNIMSRFHAAFSVGTVLGALGGAAMNALDVGVTPHVLVSCAVVVVLVNVSVRSLLPDAEPEPDQPRGRNPFAAWREPRTVLIGVFVLTMAFTEGTGNDWLSVAAIDGHGASKTVGSLFYVSFVAAMTVGRWFGPGVLDRMGRVTTLRASAAVAVAGVSLVVWGPNLGTAVAGSVLWGLGTALGFPVGMSAAADEPEHSAGRVSVVATIGYVAFLAGPALIGTVGDHVGVLKALTITAGLLCVGLMLAGFTRPIGTAASSPVPAAAD